MTRRPLAVSTLPWRHWIGILILLASVFPAFGQVDVLTQHNDNARTGANLEEGLLMPSDVNVGQFGMLFERAVDDQIYSQPLVVSGVNIGGGTHNVVYVTTVHNSVYAYDADDATMAAPYWHRNFGAPVSGHFSCHDFSGNYSIVGTPVIDKTTGTLYVVDQITAGSTFNHHLHALDISTGADKAGSPVTVNIANQLQNQRPALLLANGTLYVGFSSHCDQGTYHGILIAYDPITLAPLAQWNSTPSGRMGAIWQSGHGPATDTAGNIYVVTGNGSFNGTSNFSQSIVKLSSDARLLDWFAPSNNGALSGSDTDMNSSGATVIPGTSLVISGSKEGVLYVVNSSHLGHLGGFLQRFRVSPSEVHTGVVYWNGAAAGPLIYVWGDGGHLQAYRVNANNIDTTPQAIGPETISGGRTVAQLSVSANGDSNGILWANARGTLRAYDASNVSHELYNSGQMASRDACGSFSKNAPPTIANGKVYLASFSGHFCVYGLLSHTPDFSISPTPGSQTVMPGGSTSYTVNLSALNGFNSDVTLGVTGLPAGAAGTFSPNPVAGGSGSSTLNVTTSSSTPFGTFTLTITGTGGGASHSRTVTLVVNQGGRCIIASAGHGWVNTSFANQMGGFTAQFDATPSTTSIHGHVGISNGPQTAYIGFANIVRFNATGTIDARNGPGYAAATTLHYMANATYHVRLTINIPTHKYSIFVTPPGGSEVTIGSNFDFRTEQSSVTSLNNEGAFVAATSGTLQVCNFTVQ